MRSSISFKSARLRFVKRTRGIGKLFAGLQAGAAFAFYVGGERFEIGIGHDFDVAAGGVVRDALGYSGTKTRELLFLHSFIHREIDQKIGPISGGELARGGLDRGDGRHRGKVSGTEADDKRDFGRIAYSSAK